MSDDRIKIEVDGQTIEARKGAIECCRKRTAAIFHRSTYPAKARIKFLATPLFCFLKENEFLFACALFKHVDFVGAFAPYECFFSFATFCIGIEKCSCCCGELIK